MMHDDRGKTFVEKFFEQCESERHRIKSAFMLETMSYEERKAKYPTMHKIIVEMSPEENLFEYVQRKSTDEIEAAQLFRRLLDETHEEMVRMDKEISIQQLLEPM